MADDDDMVDGPLEDQRSPIMDLFINRMKKYGPRTNDLPPELQNYTLIGQKTRDLSTHERTLIRAYWTNNLGCTISMHQIPKDCKIWQSIRLLRHQVARSAECARENATRNSSLVRYELTLDEDNTNSTISEYGYLISLLSPSIETEDVLVDETQDVAVIQRIHVKTPDSNLLQVDRMGKKSLVHVNSIKELIGLVKRRQYHYVVGQYTAFMA